jgi:hypothetical protein
VHNQLSPVTGDESFIPGMSMSGIARRLALITAYIHTVASIIAA